MNVSLTPELESYVAAKVKSGGYASASEVVREALRVLQYEENSKEAWTGEVQTRLATSMQQAQDGNFQEFASAKELLDFVKASGKQDRAPKANG